LVENGVDCGEEEFGNDFNASLQGDDGIAGDHFDEQAIVAKYYYYAVFKAIN
jgi:hypothetical protein